MTEDEMAGWHHWLDGRESGWTPGVGDGQGGLACCDSWGRKESDMTEWLNWTELNWTELGDLYTSVHVGIVHNSSKEQTTQMFINIRITCEISGQWNTTTAMKINQWELNKSTWITYTNTSLNKISKGFPGGSVVKNPSANAGDVGLIPGVRNIP